MATKGLIKMRKRTERVFVRLHEEELETLDDIAKLANLPKVRSEQIRFTIRQLRWTYSSQIGRILTDIERLLIALKEILKEES